MSEDFNVSNPTIAVRSHVSEYSDVTVDLTVEEEVNLIIRVLGPSLGVTGTSTDTSVTIYDENYEEVGSNDDWASSSSATLIQNLGLAPSDSSEAAHLISLSPGVYSLEAMDVNMEEGILQLEVFGVESDVFNKIEKVDANAEYKAGLNFYYLKSTVDDLNASFSLDATDENQVPPLLFSDSPLHFMENVYPGTSIGNIDIYGKDGFNQETASFSLVSGVNFNSLFSLEANGTLKTNVAFDYDDNQTSYLLQVQAKDDQDNTIDRNFTVHMIKDLSGLQFERILSVRAGVPAWDSMFLAL